MESHSPKFILSVNLNSDKFIDEQLKNIREHLSYEYQIVLNCDEKMHELIENKKYENVCVNPIAINKKRFHGTLFRGVYENIRYSCLNYKFDYFIVLSSRSFFFRKLNNETIKTFYDDNKRYDAHHSEFRPKTPLERKQWPRWMWSAFRKSEFYAYLRKHSYNFQKKMHEGLLLTRKNCEDLICFFDQNDELYNSVIDAKNLPMEEIVIQTLLINWQNFSTGMGVWPGGETNSENIKKRFILKKY